MRMLHTKKYTIFMLIMLLSFTLVIPAFAAEGTTSKSSAAVEPAHLGSVKLTDQSSIELKQINRLPTQDGNTVSFTISFVNGGSQDMNLIDYWFRLSSKSGASYSINPLSAEKDKNRIAARTSQEFTFYASTGKNVKLEDLNIQVIKWDFTQPNYQRNIGVLSVPAEYSQVTDVDQSKLLTIANTEVASLVESFKVNKSSESYITSISFEYENTGARAVTIPEYNYFVRTSEGLLYALERVGASSNPLSIQPRVKRNIQLNASVPISIKPQNWELLITLSEGEGKIELPAAYYKLSNTAFEHITSNISEKRELMINNVPVESYISRAVIRENKQGGHDASSIYFVFENIGTKEAALPNYEYVLKTKDGIHYPLVTESKDIVINPKVTSEIELNVTIPNSVNTEELELIVNQAAEDSSPSPIATYKVPKESAGGGLGIGKVFNYTDGSGEYGIELGSVQRLPWGDEDIIAAEIILSNEDDHTLPLLDLSGKFKLDGIEMDVEKTQLILLDKVLGLRKKASAKIIIYMKVPYTYEYDQVSLVINEKEGEAAIAAKEIVEFVSNSQSLRLPVVKRDKSHKISNIGKRADISVKEIQTYIKGKSKLLYTVLEIENLEDRQTELIKLAAYLKTDDDAYYSAQSLEYEERIIPGGKSLVSFWSIIPEKYSAADFQLIVGEEAASGDDKAFINAVAFDLPVELGGGSSNIFTEMAITPYTFKINGLSVNDRTVLFNYNLVDQNQYEFFPENHKLVIEFVTPRTTQMQEFEIGTTLVMGSNQSAQFSLNLSEDDLIRLQDEGYLIRIYDQFEGYRKLLASSGLRD